MYRGWAMLALFYWTYKVKAKVYGRDFPVSEEV
jgi:hypothetical protein